MAVLLRNKLVYPITLPAPLKGIVPGGKSVVVDGTIAEVMDYIGPVEHVREMFELKEVPDSQLANSVKAGVHVVARIFSYPALAAFDDTGSHAGHAGNSETNVFPGPYVNPAVPRCLALNFAEGWDGGDIIITGTNQFDEPIVENAGGEDGDWETLNAFKTITEIRKTLVGADAAACSVGWSNNIGLPVRIASDKGALLDGEGAASLGVNLTYNVFSDLGVGPNGEIDYLVLFNVYV